MLKALFGTATVMDLNQLHSTVDELHKRVDLITHSLNSQVTYFKELDRTVKFNAETIIGLSDALKSIANKAQEGFQEVASKLAWFNL
jgi:methyl-accepting chemotaxis protein